MSRTVFIDGEAGTTGLQIRDRLRGLDGVSVTSLGEARRRDREARRAAMEAADLVVLCLPDEAAREAAEWVEGMGSAAPRLLDASTAHRTAPGWVYGFPELAAGQAKAVAVAPRVANPGCYATGAIALIRPLTDAGIIPPEHPLTIMGVSGYSGGGKAMIADHEAAGGPAFQFYALSLHHKHLPEIVHHGGLERRPIFLPAVGHFRQGMLVTVPLDLDSLPGRPTAREIGSALAEHYETVQTGPGAHVVLRPPPSDRRIGPEPIAGSDLMELMVIDNEAESQAVLMARLDNLGKGAAGAAVQNIALMLGLDATHSLDRPRDSRRV